MSYTILQRIHEHHLIPPRCLATVTDTTHQGIVSCPADATLTDVARLMATHHGYCTSLIGGSHDQRGGALVEGLISDLDVTRAGIRVGPEESAAALALEPRISVEATTGLSQVGEFMLKHGVSHVVVIDSVIQRPTGVRSTLDVIGVLAWAEA